MQAEPDVDAPVFTPAELQGDFSNSDTGGTPDSGVKKFLKANPYFASNANNAIINPAHFDPVAQNYLNAGLIPSAPGGSPFTNRRISSRN